MSVNSLEACIKQALVTKPYLNFAELMEITQYHPTYGYYCQQSVFGSEGDFITAPMLSVRLAKSIAAWLIEQGVSEVLEVGPGNGWLAKILLEMMPTIERYYLLEKSTKPMVFTDKRAQQITRVPNGYRGAIIANEWLDALPFRRFVWDQDAGLLEYRVLDEQGVCCKLMPSQETLWFDTDLLPSPFCVERIDYGALFPVFKNAKGPCLLIDYGYQTAEYYHPDRALGTMLCIQNHQVVPFSLKAIGQFDITCAVDWDRVIQKMDDLGYSLERFGTQADFLHYYLDAEGMGSGDRVLFEASEMGQYVKVASFRS